jgi:hypothetical protein
MQAYAGISDIAGLCGLMQADAGFSYICRPAARPRGFWFKPGSLGTLPARDAWLVDAWLWYVSIYLFKSMDILVQLESVGHQLVPN